MKHKLLLINKKLKNEQSKKALFNDQYKDILNKNKKLEKKIDKQDEIIS